MMRPQKVLFPSFSVVAALLVALILGELAVCVKNTDGRNYHIEMWKYSKKLKQRSKNAILGHEHIPGSSAKLQNVDIRINSDGMRGAPTPPVSPGQRRILFIGSSATFGWGVEEKETMTSIVSERFSRHTSEAIVMNAGVGNYNAERYVNLFLMKGHLTKPTDIVVNFYLNDTEVLGPGGGGWLMRNSQLAVSVWVVVNRYFKNAGKPSLVSYYQDIYEGDNVGYLKMQKALKKLSVYAKENKIKLYLVMLPELRDLADYEYGFAHQKMRKIADEMGYVYIDALEFVRDVEDVEGLWVMPGDPHPGVLAHRLFGEGIYQRLKSP